jgi:hypothetical protein
VQPHTHGTKQGYATQSEAEPKTNTRGPKQALHKLVYRMLQDLSPSVRRRSKKRKLSPTRKLLPRATRKTKIVKATRERYLFTVLTARLHGVQACCCQKLRAWATAARL